jgi:hypothetical protein
VIREGNRIVVNPGELGGWVTGKKTFAIWDTEADLPEIVEF